MGIENVCARSQSPFRRRALTAVIRLAAAVTSLAAAAAPARAQTSPDVAAGALVQAGASVDDGARAWSQAVRPPPLRTPASLGRSDGLSAAQEGSRRQTWRGAKIGGIAGAVAGLGVGGFIALWCRAEGDPCDAAVPVVTLLGAAGGAVGGAIIGAAIPRHPDTGRVAPPVERRIGSASLSLGVVHARQEDYAGEPFLDGSGPAARLNLYAELRPWLAIGPEAGIAWTGGGVRRPVPGDDVVPLPDEGGKVRHAAVAVRLSGRFGGLAPYAGGNVGAYQTTGPSLEFLGGAVMAGARWTPGAGRGFIDVDARYGGNLQNIEPMRFRGLYIGGGLYW
jgi:hypothetical protein